MKPQHHLDHSTLLAYAAGTLDGAFTVVAAAHLGRCEACRRAVRAAEAVGGLLLEEIGGNPVSDACKTRTLAMLGQATVHRFPAAAAAPSEVPAPLARLLNVTSFDQLAWKKKAPGVAIINVKLPDGAKGRLKLLRFGAGRAMPAHGHGGEEITMVLRGAYNDHMGRFAPGDVADLDVEIEHQPVVETGSDCICLVATERPTRFKSFAARLMQPLVGL